MDSITILIVFVLAATSAAVVIRTKYEQRQKAKQERLRELKTKFMVAREELERWEACNLFHAHDDPEFQLRLGVKIFCLKQLIFSKGHLTYMEKRYLLGLQELQAPRRQWSD